MNNCPNASASPPGIDLVNMEYSKNWLEDQGIGVLLVPTFTIGQPAHQLLDQFLVNSFNLFKNYLDEAFNEYGLIEYLKERFEHKLDKEGLFSLLSGPVQDNLVHDSLKIKKDGKVTGYKYGHLRFLSTPVCKLQCGRSVVSVLTLPVGRTEWNPGFPVISLRWSMSWLHSKGIKADRILFPIPDVPCMDELVVNIKTEIIYKGLLIGLDRDLNTPGNTANVTQ